MPERPRTILKALCLLSYLAVAVACGGGGPGTPPPPPDDTVDAPTGLSYSSNPGQYRMDAAIAPNMPTLGGGDPVDAFAIDPAPPAGLMFDTTTGILSGTPTATATATDHTVTATNAGGQAQAAVNIAVGAALPAAFESLAAGFDAEVIHESQTGIKHAKIVFAPDGRIFFTEVDTGNIRIIDAAGNLLATPFVSVTTTTTGHAGLLGLALAPDFTTSGHVYALATVPAVGMQSDRSKIFRWTEASNLATNEMIVLDDLPIAPSGGVNNGGEIVFDQTGMLFVSLGDVQNAANAQAPISTSLAGKVLRYDVSSLPATPAAGNPTPGDPEWCKGLRNTFAMCIHPVTGGLFGTDNGPAADDELNYLSSLARNFEWGGMISPPVGTKIRNWQTVITPTGICWHDGTGWGADYNNDLFITTYSDQDIVRIEMSGSAFTDIDNESKFAAFLDIGDDNRPLDIVMASDGSLYVSTYTGIYRITKP